MFKLARADIEEEENVLVLNKDNFDEALKLHPFLLVEYYAPWCGHCKALAPKYAAAATKLKEEGSEIKLAKVDATIEKELGDKAGVQGFPTIKFYKNDNKVEYTGGRDTDQIISWLKKRSGPVAKQLSTAKEVSEFGESANVVVIGFFEGEDSAEAKEFLKSAEAHDDVAFGVFYEESAKPSVVLNSKDEGKFEFYPSDEGFKSSKIDSFIKINSAPIGAEFGENTYQKNFASGINYHLLLFVSSKAEGHQDVVAYFKSVAKDNKGKMTFMWVDVDKSDNQGALSFFDLEAAKEGETFTPTMRIVTFGEDTNKFLPKVDTIDEQSLRDFASGVLEGKIERHYKSAPLPDDWDAKGVKVLVASNFHEFTGVDNGKNVLVEFYAPWCGHCKQLAPIWDELGEKYKDHESIAIAKMDATANEVKGVSVKGFPTIKYYKTTGEVLDYEGKRDLEGFTKYLESDGIQEEKEEPESEEEPDLEEPDMDEAEVEEPEVEEPDTEEPDTEEPEMEEDEEPLEALESWEGEDEEEAETTEDSRKKEEL